MSLSSIIRSKEPECKVIQEIIKSVAPLKASFTTQSGLDAFSRYPMIHEYQLSNNFEASIVGTAFDLITRIVCSYYTNSKMNTDQLMEFWIGVYLDKNPDVDKLYSDGIKTINELINTKPIGQISIRDEVINAVWLCAKLETLWRSGFLQNAEKKDVIELPNDIVKQDIMSMTASFMDKFIDSGLVKPNSLITYSPTFSTDISLKLGGIVADICIDDTLFDIKSTKKLGFAIQDSIQLTAYYLFYLLDLINDADEDLQRHKIKRIAFYKSRYAQIEYFNVDDIPPVILVNALLGLNDKFELGISKAKIKKVMNIKC